MNARMYAVTPDVERGWEQLLGLVAKEAEVPLRYLAYAAPQPLEALWAREDLGMVFMCGYPIALRLAPVTPIAAPIPSAAWAQGRPLYRTDLIVRQDAPYQRLEDTFGGRAGYTVAHSHSGFNAFRHHLLSYRNPQRPMLYGQMLGNLITARNILDSVREGRIDVGPLDAYWHALLARHAPQRTSGVRVLESTAAAPIPALVAASTVPPATLERLRGALLSAADRPWFARLGNMLELQGFAPVTEATYSVLLDWAGEARAAGYDQPA